MKGEIIFNLIYYNIKSNLPQVIYLNLQYFLRKIHLNSRTAAMFNFNSRELKASTVGYVTSYRDRGLSAVQIYSVFYKLQHVSILLRRKILQMRMKVVFQAKLMI